MNFQGLQKIEKANVYIDHAMRHSSKSADRARDSFKGSDKNRLIRSKNIELARIDGFCDTLLPILDKIVKSYPSFDDLDPFYQELIRVTLDVDQLKKSLAAVNWAKRSIQNLKTSYRAKIKSNKSIPEFNKFRTAFLGRACSILRQVKTDFVFLEESRRVLGRFPALKTSWFSVVIAGVPNVGKSTLLSSLTGSKPEVAYYPFTTKNLNFGSDKVNKIQFVDTPGLLDRPLKKRNKIEEQAIIALKHLANLIVYIFDPSTSCGYSLDDQKNLLKVLKKMFKVPFIIVQNKADLGTADIDSFIVSAKEGVGVSEVKEKILAFKNISDE